jgi:23S rRNA-/tRNA-specific pseudouridylate synthase
MVDVPSSEEQTSAHEVALSFVFEDEHIFVIHKPSGVHSVQLASGDRSIADKLLATTPSLASVAEKPGDAGLVQRLDYETQGLLLGARTRESWTSLRSALQSGGIQKRYLIIVDGAVRESMTIDSPIGSPYRRAGKMRVYRSVPKKGDRALPARTNFNPLWIAEGGTASILLANAPTARRHQIRAHSAALGHPLTGDSLYGSKQTLPSIIPQSTETFFLLALDLLFRHPVTGLQVQLQARKPLWLPSSVQIPNPP